jgi:hypothetical protein
MKRGNICVLKLFIVELKYRKRTAYKIRRFSFWNFIFVRLEETSTNWRYKLGIMGLYLIYIWSSGIVSADGVMAHEIESRQGIAWWFLMYLAQATRRSGHRSGPLHLRFQVWILLVETCPAESKFFLYKSIFSDQRLYSLLNTQSMQIKPILPHWYDFSFNFFHPGGSRTRIFFGGCGATQPEFKRLLFTSNPLQCDQMSLRKIRPNFSPIIFSKSMCIFIVETGAKKCGLLL